MEMATDLKTTFNESDCMKLVGYDMTRTAAQKAFSKAGIQPTDVQGVYYKEYFYSTNEFLILF
jgi:sterol carrier protein 2